MGKCMTVKVYIENYNHKRVHIATVNTDEGKSQKVTITSEIIPEVFTQADSMKLLDTISNRDKKKGSTLNVCNTDDGVGMAGQTTSVGITQAEIICDNSGSCIETISTIEYGHLMKPTNFNPENCSVRDVEIANHITSLNNAILEPDNSGFMHTTNFNSEESSNSPDLMKETNFKIVDFLNEVDGKGNLQYDPDNNLQQLTHRDPMEIESDSNEEGSDCVTNLEEYFIIDKLIGTRFNEKSQKNEYLFKPKKCTPKNNWNPIAQNQSCDISLYEYGRLYMQAPRSLKLIKKKTRRSGLTDQFLSESSQDCVLKSNVNLNSAIVDEKVTDEYSTIQISTLPHDQDDDILAIGIPRMESFEQVNLIDPPQNLQSPYISDIKSIIKRTVLSNGCEKNRRPEEFTAKCEFCDFRSKNMINLKIHTETHFGKVICPDCGAEEINTLCLNRHRLIHESPASKEIRKLERERKRKLREIAKIASEKCSSDSGVSDKNVIKSRANKKFCQNKLKKNRLTGSKFKKIRKPDGKRKRIYEKKEDDFKSENKPFPFLNEATVSIPKLILPLRTEYIKEYIRSLDTQSETSSVDPTVDKKRSDSSDVEEFGIQNDEQTFTVDKETVPMLPSMPDLLMNVDILEEKDCEVTLDLEKEYDEQIQIGPPQAKEEKKETKTGVSNMERQREIVKEVELPDVDKSVTLIEEILTSDVERNSTTMMEILTLDVEKSPITMTEIMIPCVEDSISTTPLTEPEPIPKSELCDIESQLANLHGQSTIGVSSTGPIRTENMTLSPTSLSSDSNSQCQFQCLSSNGEDTVRIDLSISYSDDSDYEKEKEVRKQVCNSPNQNQNYKVITSSSSSESIYGSDTEFSLRSPNHKKKRPPEQNVSDEEFSLCPPKPKKRLRGPPPLQGKPRVNWPKKGLLTTVCLKKEEKDSNDICSSYVFEIKKEEKENPEVDEGVGLNRNKKKRCIRCGVLCRDERDLQCHLAMNHRRHDKVCEICRIKFPSTEKLEKHCVENHDFIVLLERVKVD